jgi:hypothetical protein
VRENIALILFTCIAAISVILLAII